jgi:molybdopterin/thiamine biosynthesis adenylyltransferase/nitroreductase
MKELIKVRSPKKRLSPGEIDQIYEAWAAERDTDLEGNWIFYPWTNRLLHVLNEEDFITLRTTRNHYKITPQEQAELSKRKIGIIGLSVGHAVAISMATERICGTLKLADFDTIELSNLNRIKTGIHNLGINKCIVTAREIAEIDPYLEIQCYPDGITEANIDHFLTEGGNLDILVDECDDLEVKISCRKKAKSLGIPVVMETSDRGMLDVERFDLETERPILHGFLAGIPEEKLKNIAPADRFPLLVRIIDVMNTSARGRASLLEVGQSISTWPQLASAVTLGGGVVTDVCRRILLNQFTESGRYYVDLEHIVGNKNTPAAQAVYSNTNEPFSIKTAFELADLLPKSASQTVPRYEDIAAVVNAAAQAPSAGNDQPWKWLFRNGRLHLFHDTFRSHAFVNINNAAAHLSLGAAFENALLKARQLGYETETSLFPLPSAPELVATIDFQQNEDKAAGADNADLAPFIDTRATNRNYGIPYALNPNELGSLRDTVERVEGAQVQFIQDKDQISQLGKIIGACDLMLMLNEAGHQDFFERNIRWAGSDSEYGDGFEIQSIAANPQLMATLAILKEPKIARTLRAVGGGNALAEATQAAINTASCIAAVIVDDVKNEYFKGGIAAQRLWLRVEQLGLSAEPLNSALALFERLATGDGLDALEKDKLTGLQQQFENIVSIQNNTKAVFLLKINKTEMPTIKSKRLPLNEILFIKNDEI